MFMLLAIPVGIGIGRLLGGRIERLSGLEFRWGAVAVGGLLIQLALFTPLGSAVAGGLSEPLYVGSTAAVLVAVVRNLAIPGMWIVTVGAVSNLAAIAANGGAMPADPGALALAGFDGPGEHTNSIVLAEPALQPLTDVYAIPAWFPLANVFSVGDVLIALGIVVAIATVMRRGSSPAARPAGSGSRTLRSPAAPPGDA